MSDRSEHESAVQALMETGDLEELQLQAPFDQTIKPHTYSLSEAFLDTAALPTGGPRGAHSLGERAAPLAAEELSKLLEELPLLPVDRTSEPQASEEGAGEEPPEGPDKKPDLSVIAKLGEGGMGKVLLARQRSLQREVAIKSVKSKDSHLATQAILHEGQIMGSLSHPNVVPVYAMGLDRNGKPVLVMKRVEGVSWQELLEPAHAFWGELPPEERLLRHLEIFMDVCNAVAFAHQRGILHRDIKPDNVMIGELGEVLLLDWGLGLWLDEEGLARTDGKMVGTPSYMAPEMVHGELSAKTDIYLLGSTLHALLMGSPRHAGASIYKVIFSVMDSAPFAYPDSIPEELAGFCNKAMHREPQQRFESVVAFKEAIAGYLRHRGSLQLTDVADQKLAELRALLDAQRPAQDQADDEDRRERSVAIEVLSSECQFAYMQALQQWAENRRAQAGMERFLESMCGYQLDRQRPEAAEALLQRMKTPPQALSARCEALKLELQRERLEHQSLRQIKEELDFEKKPLPRMLFTVGLTLVVMAVIVFSYASGEPLSELTYREALNLDFLLLGSLGALLWWKRDLLLARRIDRRFFAFIGLCFLSGLLFHLIFFYLQLPIRTSNICEEITFTLLCLFAGLTLQPWFYIGSAVTGLSTALMIFIPQHHALIYTINGVFLLFYLVSMLYFQIRRAALEAG